MSPASPKEPQLHPSEAEDHAKWLAKARYDADRITRRLVSKGIDEARAREAANKAVLLNRKKERTAALLHVALGAAILAVGAGLTIQSYLRAGETGGVYWLFYGAILVGLCDLIFGLVRLHDASKLSRPPTKVFEDK